MTFALTMHAGICMCGMHWPNNCTETDYQCAIRPTGSTMEFIHILTSNGKGDELWPYLTFLWHVYREFVFY